MKYQGKKVITYVEAYEVEANSEEEAQRIIEDGESEDGFIKAIHTPDYDYVVDSYVQDVEVQEQKYEVVVYYTQREIYHIVAESEEEAENLIQEGSGVLVKKEDQGFEIDSTTEVEE